MFDDGGGGGDDDADDDDLSKSLGNYKIFHLWAILGHFGKFLGLCRCPLQTLVLVHATCFYI